MHIFVTGATGFIGLHVVPELIKHGHTVLGLTRSDEGAAKLTALGAVPHRGDLTDLESLKSGAAKVDGVIHLAFDHDFSNFVANCEKDKRAIDAIGEALAGTNKPFLITSGTGVGTSKQGEPSTEDVLNAEHPNPRKISEIAGHALEAKGVNVIIIRLPQVHDPTKSGFGTFYIAQTRTNGYVAYIGDGSNRWPAAHVDDVARLYRLAIEKNEKGATYNATAEDVPLKRIAEVVGKGLNFQVKSITPEEAPAVFGWLSHFIGLDMPASNKITREKLGWNPTGPTLISDLEQNKF